ncbi:Serine/threonine-protein kinase 19 [Chamberlinius hualienensis]
MNKKSKISDFYGGQRKRLRISKNDNSDVLLRPLPPQNLDDVHSALILLRSQFPVDKLEQRLPPIILKHQLYSLLKNRTTVDRQLNEMKQTGVIRCFHLGVETDAVAIVLREDFQQHIKNTADGNEIADRFLNYIFSTNYNELSITRDALIRKRICKEEEITELMRIGMLTVRDVGSWWLAIPAAGQFMKYYLKGRKAILTTIKKSKYSEILEKELMDRKLPKVAKLGMDYYVHDIIGAELVATVPTTSGRLLRLTDYS